MQTVTIDRAAYLAAMAELHRAFVATAEAAESVPGVAGSIGIAMGCLVDGQSQELVDLVRGRRSAY